MVLHAEVAGLLAAILHDFVSKGPVLLAELRGLHEVNPRLVCQSVAEHLDTILEVSDLAVLHDNLHLVPLAGRVGVLRLCDNHVVEACALADAEGGAELSIGVTLVVEHLALGAADVDGLIVELAAVVDGLRDGNIASLCLFGLGSVIVDGSRFLAEVEDAGVAAFANLPFNLELKVLELVSEDDVAAFAVGCAAVEVQSTVLDVPLAGDVVLAVAAPAVEACAIEEDIVAVLVNLQRAEVNLRVLYNDVLRLLLYEQPA